MVGKNEFKLAVIIAAVDRLTPFLSTTQSKLGNFARATDAMGRRLSLTVSAPIAGVFALAFKQGVQAQKALKGVRFATDATAEELVRAREAAENFAGPFTDTESLNAMKALGQQGLKVGEAIATLPPIIDLATAAETDLTEAVDSTFAVLRAYNLDVAKAAHLTNVLGIAALRTRLGLSGVASELSAVAPLAAAVGLNLEGVAAAVIELQRRGQPAGAVLTAMLRELAKPSKAAIERFTKLKIVPEDIHTAAGALKPLPDILELLTQRGASAADMFAIFGKRAGRGVLALQQGLGPLRETESLLSKDGHVAFVASEKMKGLGNQLRELLKNWEKLLERIAKPEFIKAVTSLVSKFADLVEKVAELPQPLLDSGVKLAAFVALVGPAIVTFTKLGGSIAWVARNLKLLAVAQGVAAAAGAGAAGVSAGAGAAATMVGVGAARSAGLAAIGRVIPLLGIGALQMELAKRPEWDHRRMIQDFQDDYLRRVAEKRAAGAAGAPNAKVEVQLNGAPPGSRVTSSREQGIDVDVRMGPAMSGL